MRRTIRFSAVAAILCACVPDTVPENESISETEQEIVTYTFDTTEVFDTGTGLPADMQRGADPFVRVASNDDVYVGATSAIVNPFLSDGGALWRSTDSGLTWTYLGTAGFLDHMGAEAAMDIDSNGRLWMAEFHLGADVTQIYRYDNPSAIVNRSTDYSATAFATPPGERPWISSYGNRIHVQYGEALVEPGIRLSLDGSANPPVFTPTIPIAQNPALRAEVATGTNSETSVLGIAQGPLAVNQSNGVMCAPLLTLNGPTANYMPAHSLWTACSSDGLTWTNTLVYNNPAVGLMNFWPESAIDSAGNLYFLVAANMDSLGIVTTGLNIFLFSSTNGGITWSAPKKVNAGGGTNLFPKAVGRCNGGIDIIWYGTSTAGQPDTLASTTKWHVYMSQSKNATAASPTWNETEVTDTVIHYGPVNHKGSFGAADYRWLTMPGITLDDDAKANIIWADTSSAFVFNPPPTGSPLTQYMGNPSWGRLYHSRQKTGPKLDTCP